MRPPKTNAAASVGHYELIVMGAARRVGEPLFFGETVAAVFEQTPASILLVSS